MAADENGQPIAYKLDMSATVALEIESLIQQAYLQGIGPKVALALKSILERLHNDPLEFGELVRHYSHLNLLVHVAIIHPVVVYFAIHPEQNFVIIQKVFLLSPGG